MRGSLYAQPGGGDNVDAAAKVFPADFIEALNSFVARGGGYLGVCMGAYLAGREYFGLLDKTVEGQVNTHNFSVTDSADYVVPIQWGDTVRWTYFQEGAQLPDGATETYALYETGDVAAAYYAFGNGGVALIGPHPEADPSWFEAAGLSDPDGDDWSYALPLVRRVLH